METWETNKVLFRNHVHSGPTFVQHLDEDFSSFLRISKETLGTTKEAFSNKKVITVVSPNERYEIGLKMSEEEVLLEKGWPEFSRAHHLCKTDKLEFFCVCPGIFIVHIYDQNGKLVLRGSRSTETETDPVQKPMSNNKTHEVPSTRQEVISISSDSSSSNAAAKGQSSGVKRHGFSVKRESETDNSSESEDGDLQVAIRIKMTFISSRRAVTNVEEMKTLRAAECFQSTISRPCFLKVMKKTSVYKEFVIVVPVKFAKANLLSKLTKISLRVPGRTEKWEVHCRFSVQRKQKLWRIMGGWWQFTLANNLEEHDVCVFVLKDTKDLSKVTMNVYIFRVVKEIVPLRVL